MSPKAPHFTVAIDAQPLAVTSTLWSMGKSVISMLRNQFHLPLSMIYDLFLYKQEVF
jgi:hypothetical protein